MTRRVIILGSTGSIGTQAIDVVSHVNALHEAGRCETRLEVVGLAAGCRAVEVFAQAARLGVRDVALADADGVRLTGLATPEGVRLRTGADAAERLVREVECDLVLSAMVGVAGLHATLATVELGRDVALANKETLVAAGGLVVPAARRSGARLLPVDSEHSGVWQCLRGRDAETERRRDEGGSDEARSGGVAERQSGKADGVPMPPLVCAGHVRRVVLTASGGPFRTWTREAMANATVEQALKHPTWSMGPKVTIDCASLINKGLELIEAHWLFGLEPDRLGVLIHPQSIVHALVEHVDGSVIAQLGSADMRTPIMHAMLLGGRVEAAAPRMDWARLRSLEFEEVDGARFPAVGLAIRAMREGGTAGAVLNGANEEAVLAFLRGRDGGGRIGSIGFGQIAGLVERAMDEVGVRGLGSIGDVMEADRSARLAVRRAIGVDVKGL